jgi:hypothetical protein
MLEASLKELALTLDEMEKRQLNVDEECRSSTHAVAILLWLIAPLANHVVI